MAGRNSVAAYAFKEAAARFYERIGLVPKSVTLEMPS
jgi:hypothetical protein